MILPLPDVTLAGVQGRVVRMADEALIRPGPATAKAALALADRIVEAAGR